MGHRSTEAGFGLEHKDRRFGDTCLAPTAAWITAEPPPTMITSYWSVSKWGF